MKRILVLVLLFPWQPVQAQTCQARDVCEMGPIMGWDLSEGAPIQIRKISTGIITDSTFKKYALGATFFGSACPNSMQKPVAVSVTGKFKEARPSPTDERVIRRSPLVTEPLVRPHTGLDYGCSDGNAIHPMADGRVISTADSSTYGCNMVVYHPALKVYTRYAHMKRKDDPTGDCNFYNLTVDESVEMSDIIGECGNTGPANLATHLHFEVMTQVGSKFIDPEEFLNNDCMVKSQVEPEALALLRTPPVEAKLPKDPNAMYGPNGQVSPGQTMSYTVEFENIGDGTAYGVYITDIFGQYLDAANLAFRDAYLVDWTSGARTPASFPHAFDATSGMLTVLAGEFGPKQGGSFIVDVKLRGDTPRGAEISNYATVYFPTSLEATRTNSVVSVVPLESGVTYSGFASARYGDYTLFQATVSASGSALTGKTVLFSVGGSSYSAVSDTLGVARAFTPATLTPGNYELTAEFPGDGYYYLPSSARAQLAVLKENTILELRAPNVAYPSSATAIVSRADDEGDPLAAPGNVYLEYEDSGTWKRLGEASVSTMPVSMTFALPLPLTRSYELRARFDGDSMYEPSFSTASLRVIDRTPPVITITSPAAGAKYAGNTPFRVHYSAADELDPSPTSYALLSRLADGATVQVTNGEQIVPMNLSAGAWLLAVTAADADGNISTAAAGPFEIVHDILPPRTSLQIGEPVYYSTMVYVSSLTPLGFAVFDDLSEPGDNSGLGTGGTFYRVGNSPFAAWDSSFTLSGEGLHYITWYSTDVAGNSETTKTSTVAVDNTPPVTTYILHEAFSGSSGIYLSSRSAISLESADPGEYASGDPRMYYGWDTEPIGLYSAPVTTVGLSSGHHELIYYAIDNLGNREQRHHLGIIVDTMPPLAAINSPSKTLKGVDKIFNAFVPLDISYGDENLDEARLELCREGSPVENCSRLYYSTAPAPGSPLPALDASAYAAGRYTLRLRVLDLAGNTALDEATVYIGEPARSLEISGLGDTRGIAADPEGNIYVSDFRKDRVLKFAPSGEFTALFGAAAGLKNPSGIEIDGNGYLYIADTGNHRIAMLDPYGRLTLEICAKTHGKCSPARDGLHGPTGIAVSASRICAADKDGIKVYDLGGKLLLSIGRSETGEDDRYYDVAFDTAGNIYAGDMEHDKLVVYSPSGEKLREISGFERPVGIAASAYLYLSDFEAGKLYKYDFAGTKGMELRLKHAFAAAVGADGALYTSEREKGVINRFVADPQAPLMRTQFREPEDKSRKPRISRKNGRTEVCPGPGHHAVIRTMRDASSREKDFYAPEKLQGRISYEYRPVAGTGDCRAVVYDGTTVIEEAPVPDCEPVLVIFGD